MFISEDQLKKAEEKIDDKIEDLKQKVNVNQGKIILISREIISGEREHCFGSISDSTHYMETGIIQGELKLFDDILHSEFIYTLGLRDSSKPSTDFYSYSPQVQIPVKKKLSKSSMLFSLDFLIQELENCKEEGIIGIQRLEFDLGVKRGFESTPGVDMPYLQSLEILIGEEEILNFTKGKIPEGNIVPFFYLMRKSGEIEDSINHHYNDERKKLAEKLIQNTAQLCMFNNKIKKLEKNVLNAKFHHYGRDEGEWSVPYRDYVYEYENIAKSAKKVFKEIEKNFDDGDKIQLIKYPEIDLRTLGIPDTVKTEDFLNYLKKEVLSDYSERVKKIDEHIKKQYN